MLSTPSASQNYAAPENYTAPGRDDLRPDLLRIADWIEPGSKVLDLGCGGGSLLHHVTEHRQVQGWGVELSEAKLLRCVQRGISVIQGDLNESDVLDAFTNNQFDVAVMSLAIQALKRPASMLQELLRISHEGIVTFPNFGHWRCRWQIARGQMPVTNSLPDRWFNTDNIHLCTVKDFEQLCAENGIAIIERAFMDRHHRTSWRSQAMPNLFGETAQYRLKLAP